MTKIVIYTKDICPYCNKAKALLQRKKAQYQEIKITDEKIKEEMIKKANGRLTVPQIFINDFHVYSRKPNQVNCHQNIELY